MANEVQNMTLAQAGLNFNKFNPLVFTPTTADMSILANSLAQREARETKATEQVAAFNNVATQLRAAVNPAEHQWVDDYIEKSSKDFTDSINAGNFSTGMKQAILAGSNLMKAPEAVGRIKAQEKFDKEVNNQKDRVKNKKISQETFDWWMNNNPYHYEDIKDSNGNIISGTDNPIDNVPVDDIDISELAKKAYTLIVPDVTSTQNSWNKTSNKEKDTIGKKPNQVIVGKNITEGRSGSSQRAFKQVTREEILNNMENLIADIPDGERALEQKYKVAVYSYNEKYKLRDKLQAEYDNKLLLGEDDTELANTIKQLNDELYVRSRTLCGANGQKIPSYKDYFVNEILESAYAQGLANKSVTTASSYGSTTQVDTNAGPGNPNNPDGNPFGTETKEIGPHTRMQNNTSTNFASLNQSSNNVYMMFTTPNTKTDK